MDAQSIPEPTFLLTELRYTLGQLHVQIGDLETREVAQSEPGGRSIDGILEEMLADESKYQQQYERMLGIQPPAEEPVVPLPVQAGEERPGPGSRFEHARAETVAMLEGAGAEWPEELIEAVRQQVAADRRHTTEIAELRQRLFNQPTRPDLSEPLTRPE